MTIFPHATAAFFYIFMVVSNIILLNILIAVVSDSYEKGLVSARDLIFHSRLQLSVELMHFPQLLFAERRLNIWLKPGRISFDTFMTAVESGGDEIDSDDWEGRSLELEKRIKKLIKESEARTEARTKDMLEAMIQASEARIVAAVKMQTPDALIH